MTAGPAALDGDALRLVDHVVEAIHLDQLREHGGPIGLRDETSLESALARPRHHWTDAPESDLPRMAAAYAFGICTDHPFVDGNKRIAFLTAVVFLGLNGLDLDAPEEEVVERIIALASADLSEEALAEWIRARVRPRSG